MSPDNTNIVLHIGTHKTGTTALQGYFWEHAHLLAQNGFTWISDSYDLPGLLLNARNAGNVQALVDGIRESLAKMLSTGQKAIFSSEGFSGSPASYYDEEAINFMAETCRTILAGYNTKIILYLRRQDLFYESYYSQCIQEGRSFSFDEYIAEFPYQSLKWDKIINAYISCFSKDAMLVRPYIRSELKAGDIVVDFLYHTAINPLADKPTEASWTNDSYSIPALKMARRLNSRLSEQAQRNKLRAILQKSNYKQPFEHHNFLSKKMRKEILDYFVPVNQSIADRFWAGQNPFTPDSASYPEPVNLDNLSLDDTLDIFTKMIIHYSK